MSSTNDRKPLGGPSHQRARPAVPPGRSPRDYHLARDADADDMIQRKPPSSPYAMQQQHMASPQRQARHEPTSSRGPTSYASGHSARPSGQQQRPRSIQYEPWDDDEDDMYVARRRADHAASDLARAEHLLNLQRPLELGRSFERHRTRWMVVIFVISLIIISLGMRNNSNIISFYSGMPNTTQQTAALSGALLGSMRPAGDYVLRAPPSLTVEQIDRILASYNSPATGTGQIWYNLGIERGIDPAYAVAFFIHESSAGTAQGWAGLKPDGSTTHNVGNIICAGYATCYGRFRDYSSWEVGIADWYRLIDVEYLNGRGHQTVADIIPVYAPAFENDVDGYVHVVQRLVDQWRTYGVP